MTLNDKIKELAELKKTAEQEKQKAGNAVEEIRQAIHMGESTGNIVQDFIIGAYGVLEDADKTAKILSLQKIIDAHQNEPVLVLARSRTQHEVGGCFGGGGFSTMSGRVDLFGIIKGQLKFDYAADKIGFRGKIILPTEKHATRSENGKWTLKETQIKINAFDLNKLDTWSPHNFYDDELNYECWQRTIWGLHSEGDPQCALKVLAGKEAELFFKLQEELYVWDTYGESILTRIRNGKLDANKLQDYETMFANKDESYWPAMSLLGEETPADIKKRAEEKLNKRKTEVIDNLEKYASEAHNARTTDAGKDARQNLRREIYTAIELGMHTEPRVIENYEGAEGVTLDVPTYITGLCKKYDVKITE